MSYFPLSILAGAGATKVLAAEGWRPEIFSTLVGASGGAKLLALTHLDRFLFGDFLLRSSHPMELYGSSIGSWRNAALAAPDPLAAITGLQEHYFNQSWNEKDSRPAHFVIDELCQWVIDGFLNSAATESLINHQRFTTHIVTSRGKGLNNRDSGFLLGLGMGFSALSNLVHRNLLATSFQRVVFSSGENRGFKFTDFSTCHVPLTADIVKPALLASGSIPYLMSGIRNIEGAPDGQYWDGGIIDYHFDFKNYASDGLVLYPHFVDEVVKGWFDKPLAWRKNPATLLDKVVVISPSKEYVAKLPGGKIPDRKDFSKMSTSERLAFWQIAMDESQRLAAAFQSVIESDDPLAYVRSA